jgi:hypothetical protein
MAAALAQLAPMAQQLAPMAQQLAPMAQQLAGPAAAAAGGVAGAAAAGAPMAAAAAGAGSAAAAMKELGLGQVLGPKFQKYQHLFEPLVIFVMKIVNTVIRVIQSFPTFLINLRIFLVAVFVLGIIAVMILICLVILYYMHPRFLFINRFANMTDFENRLIQDIRRCMTNVVVYGPPGSLPPQYMGTAKSICYIGILFAADGNFGVKLDILLRYQNTLLKMRKSAIYAKVGEATFKSAGLFLDEDNNYSESEMMKYWNEFVAPWLNFCKAIRSLRNMVVADRVLMSTSGVDPSLHYYLGGLIELDLVLNDYQPAALTNFGKRRSLANGKADFAIFEQYYAPAVTDMWANGLMNSFKKTRDIIVTIFMQADIYWSKLGDFIGAIPCLLAGRKYRDKCSDFKTNVTIGKLKAEYEDEALFADAFTPNKCSDCSSSAAAATRRPPNGDTKAVWLNRLLYILTLGRHRQNNKDDPVELFGEEEGKEIGKILAKYDIPAAEDGPAEEDVQENFSALFSMARAAVRFFRNFIPLWFAFVDYINNFGKDPLGSLFGIIMLIIGPWIGLFILLIYSILSLPIWFGASTSWLIAGLVAVLTAWIYFIYSFLSRVFLTIVLFFFFIGLWFVDVMTGGLLVKLMQCEEDPDAPEIRKNYVYGNGYNKGVLGCLYPCPGGFRPRPIYWLGNTSYLCSRQEKSAPNMCPQQQILRFFRGRQLVKPLMYDLHKPGLLFRFLPQSEKILTIRQTYKKRRDFLNTCHNKLSPKFEPICRHVCGNLHNYAFKSTKEKEAMKLLCKQLYCEGNTKDDGMCAYITQDPTGDQSQKLGDEPLVIMSKAFLIAIGASVLLVITLALIRAGKTRSMKRRFAS